MRLELPHRTRTGRYALNLVVLLMLVLLPLDGSVQAVTPAEAATASRATADGTAARAAKKTPRVVLRLRAARVTTKQRARVTVVVRNGSGSRPATATGPRGRVKVVARDGDRRRVVRGALRRGKARVTLPRLPAGSYRVRATFLGNAKLTRARSRARTLRVVRPGPARWPGPSNTGVPRGTRLTTYHGSCTIAARGKVIDSKIINCSGLRIRAANVTIRNSKINGRILVDTDVNRRWSLTLARSEVDAGAGDSAAIANGNVTIVRANIHGGHNGLECQEHSSYCEIRDSWIHDQWQPRSGEAHLGGLLHLGTVVPCRGTNGACVEIVHNTIVCDAKVTPQGGGCTGDINLLPHWGPLKGAIVKGNFLGANTGAAYCTFAGAGMEYPATHIVYRNNVFQRGSNRRCAAYGPVTGFDSAAAGNVWENNRYAGGSAIGCSRRRCR